MLVKIASIYGFRTYPPKGGNNVHAYQLIRHFQMAGHDVLTVDDDSAPGVTSFPATAQGYRAIGDAADVIYLRVDARPVSSFPELLPFLRSARKPLVL